MDNPPRSAFSLLFEGVGIGGTVGAATAGTAVAVMAPGTSLVVPGLGSIVLGPLFFGLTGAGFGAITGGVIGGLIGVSMGTLRR